MAIPAQRSASTLSLARRWVSRVKIRSAPAGSFAAARRATPASLSSFLPGPSRSSAAGRSTRARASARSPRTSSEAPEEIPLKPRGPHRPGGGPSRTRPLRTSGRRSRAVSATRRVGSPASRARVRARFSRSWRTSAGASGTCVEEVEQRRRRPSPAGGARRASRRLRAGYPRRVPGRRSPALARRRGSPGPRSSRPSAPYRPGPPSSPAFAIGPAARASPGSERLPVPGDQRAGPGALLGPRTAATAPGFRGGGAGASTFGNDDLDRLAARPDRRPVNRYPAFLTKTKPGASMTSAIVNRPSSSVVSLVRFGPSPDWNTSAPATPLPSASTTRPVTRPQPDGPAQDHVRQFRRPAPSSQSRPPRLHPVGRDDRPVRFGRGHVCPASWYVPSAAVTVALPRAVPINVLPVFDPEFDLHQRPGHRTPPRPEHPPAQR